MQKHAMIDLETLSNTQRAAVISIGVARFTATEVMDVSYFAIAWDDQQRDVSRSTLEWWMGQSDDARHAAFASEVERASTAEILRYYAWYLRDHFVWGNPASFDLGILKSLYEDFRTSVPWDHYNERCFRTVRNGRDKPCLATLPHDPAEDARAQAECLIEWNKERAFL